jgi:hypothetical protein
VPALVRLDPLGALGHARQRARLGQDIEQRSLADGEDDALQDQVVEPDSVGQRAARGQD